MSDFLLDANVFIEAKNRYYGFDICPGFWDALVKLPFSSIERVRDELRLGNDEIRHWVEHVAPPTAFLSTDSPEVQIAYSEVARWVESQPRFKQSAKTKFFQGADGWLVAYAVIHGRIVVTLETPAPESKNNVKLPDVCIAFNVQFQNTFEMLRSFGAPLILGV